MARRAAKYEIQHASGRITTTSATLWTEHVKLGDLVRISRRRALVAFGLYCWAEGDALKFSERHEDGFSGDVSIPSQWAALVRAWLRMPPFPERIDCDYLIRERQLTRQQVYAELM